MDDEKIKEIVDNSNDISCENVKEFVENNQNNVVAENVDSDKSQEVNNGINENKDNLTTSNEKRVEFKNDNIWSNNCINYCNTKYKLLFYKD